MKLSKVIVIGTVVYLVAFLIDYLTTLFSIDRSGVYHSKLGLKITMEMSPEEMFTTFSLTPQIIVTYISWIAILCLLYFFIKLLAKRKQLN
ncbi:hypothetical protein DX933_03885 [Ornithinibacillus gellani]|mgnify:CR=1 FL=1|uniref:hypothetical protein n=1 Tax=Ornithinibacillus gellani TaxID=2293253 RepID=UPI000F46D39F|nr:hypothetical protein [Ornithinibacillus gellani]TQS75897.1 hypothetical protein DX933_03885 [Ornithinibacillus gellani]